MKSRENGSVLCRIFPAALALAAGTVLFWTAVPPARFGVPEKEQCLEKNAEAYLKQTARILGDRFNEEFYRAAVRFELKKAGMTGIRFGAGAGAREQFAGLVSEPDAALSEALAFLDGIEGDRDSVFFPARITCAAGNPIDAAAETLVRPSPPDCPPAAAEVPISAVFLLLFSLVSIPVSAVFPVSLFGSETGIATVRDVFRRAVTALGLSAATAFSAPRKADRQAAPTVRHTPLAEKKIAVLLI